MATLARSQFAELAVENRWFEQIIGNSPALNSVLEQVELVGPTDSTVLILGETGTGKELIARAVVVNSTKAIVILTAAALPTCAKPALIHLP